MSIILSDVSYRYDNRQPLFEHISVSIASGQKASVIGQNGTGKSTLLKLIAKDLPLRSGSVSCSSQPYYIPQQIGIRAISVGRALGVAEKIAALHAICGGSSEPSHYDALSDDWDIESRCRSALDYWGLSGIGVTDSIDTLSGGEKTKLFLSGIAIHEPSIVLLDEPTNHLDDSSRQKLYDFIRDTRSTVVAVSHDITLLNLFDSTYELSEKGIGLYGGNYDFYREQKQIESDALLRQIDSEQATLRAARQKAQEVRERQEKRFSQGAKNKESLPRILRKGAKDRGEATSAKLRGKHSDIIAQSREKLDRLRQRRPVGCELKIDFEDTRLHDGKRLVAACGVNFRYPEGHDVWSCPIDLEIRSGERIHLRGNNGSGKTTLIRLITSELPPTSGEIRRADFTYVYLDQEYGRIDTADTMIELARKYNSQNMEDHEIKTRLDRALFPEDTWDKSCRTLSGGERMRLQLCCLMISNHVPDLFILDEPTNNLDLPNLAILTATISRYRGTLLVISHDRNFVREIGITRTIELK